MPLAVAAAAAASRADKQKEQLLADQQVLISPYFYGGHSQKAIPFLILKLYFKTQLLFWNCPVISDLTLIVGFTDQRVREAR